MSNPNFAAYGRDDGTAIPMYDPATFTPSMVPLRVACSRLHLSRSAAYRLIRAGNFPIDVISVRRRWFVRDDDLRRAERHVT